MLFIPPPFPTQKKCTVEETQSYIIPRLFGIHLHVFKWQSRSQTQALKFQVTSIMFVLLSAHQIRGGNFDEKYVLSSRVRTGRSIRGLSLPPACTRAERREVERVVIDALAGLKGDLAGKYYSLTLMTEQEQQQLIDVGIFTNVMICHSMLPAQNKKYSRWPFVLPYRITSCLISLCRPCLHVQAWLATGLTQEAFGECNIARRSKWLLEELRSLMLNNAFWQDCITPRNSLKQPLQPYAAVWYWSQSRAMAHLHLLHYSSSFFSLLPPACKGKYATVARLNLEITSDLIPWWFLS